MFRLTVRSVVTLLAVAVTAAGVAATPTLSPFSAAYTPTSVDERGMWQQADEAERLLRDSPAIIRDPALNAYIRQVLCRAVGKDRCDAARLYIMRVPAFNASMAPNGTLIIWSGLLLRVRSEAELAAVLGHEFGHFELRHSLAGFKRARSISDIMAWASILAPQNNNLPNALVGLHFAYVRADETAADMQGMRYLKSAGYRPGAFAEIWERLMAEEDETALGRKRHVTHHYAAGFFASHPTELTRATYLRKAAEPGAGEGDDNTEIFERTLAPWRGQFLVDQIKLNDFGGSEYLLKQLAGSHWTPELLVARGELYRERGNPRDLVSAAQFYQQAIDGGSSDPAAWRGLGMALLRNGQAASGKAALGTYLSKAPEAADRAVVAMLVDQ